MPPMSRPPMWAFPSLGIHPIAASRLDFAMLLLPGVDFSRDGERLTDDGSEFNGTASGEVFCLKEVLKENVGSIFFTLELARLVLLGLLFNFCCVELRDGRRENTRKIQRTQKRIRKTVPLKSKPSTTRIKMTAIVSGFSFIVCKLMVRDERRNPDIAEQVGGS